MKTDSFPDKVSRRFGGPQSFTESPSFLGIVIMTCPEEPEEEMTID